MPVCGCFPLFSWLLLLRIWLPCLCGSPLCQLAPTACLFPRLNKASVLNLSSWTMCSGPLTIVTVLCWTPPLLKWGLKNWLCSIPASSVQSVRWEQLLLFCGPRCLLMMLGMHFALFATGRHCWLLFNLVATVTAGTCSVVDCWPTLQSYIAAGVKLCTFLCWTSWG